MVNQGRYNPNKYPRTEARRTIIRLRATNPEWTLNQIGIEVGCSRERVRQILTSEAMETRSIKYAEDKIIPLCKYCGTTLERTRTTGKYPTYCSSECRNNQYYQKVVCFHCGRICEIRKGELRQRMKINRTIYCSKSCRSNGYWAIVHNEIPNTLDYVIANKH
jgi:hypothetical protein